MYLIQEDDRQAAIAAGRRLFKKATYQANSLESYELATLMQETYQFLKIPFQPKNNDVKAYEKVLDADKDGRVSLSDMQNKAIEYLCGGGLSLEKNPPKTYNNTSNYAIQNSQYNNNEQYSYQVQTSIKKNYQHQTSNLHVQPNHRPYTEEVMKYLGLTRNIFQKYARKRTFSITAEQVPPLLTQTYEALGRKGYVPNSQDVRVWIKLCDSNDDGHVEYTEYELFIVRSLQRAGVIIYKN